jgi:integrase
MTRRDYGSGTIYRRDDGLWVGRIEAGTTTRGTRRRITVSAKTEAACRAKLKERHREILRNGVPASGVDIRATVKSWAEKWLPVHATKARPKYYATDASIVRKWIIPTIGHRRLTDLTPADVRAVRTAIVSAGRSTTTAHAAHGTLMRMLRAARAENHEVPIRVLEVDAPGKASNDRDAIAVDHALLLLAEAMRNGGGHRWVAAILQGMRQGEVLGLTWECVDLERGVIDVSWQKQELPYIDPKDHSKGFLVPDDHESRHLTGATHLTRPKTSHGQRVIPLVPFMHAALTELRKTWVPNPWGLVFADVDTRYRGDRIIPLRAEKDRAHWYTLQERVGVAHPAGRPYLVHEARHTTATLLLEAGVDPIHIEAILGHAELVKAYLHVSTDSTRAALGRVADRLNLTLPAQITEG